MSLYVLVSPQNCRNFIICCAASAQHKQQHQKAHDDSLAHRERYIKASPSRALFFFFTYLFNISKIRNVQSPCSSSLLPKTHLHDSMCWSLATNIQQDATMLSAFRWPQKRQLIKTWCLASQLRGGHKSLAFSRTSSPVTHTSSFQNQNPGSTW